jgi:hypothetical protein
MPAPRRRRISRRDRRRKAGISHRTKIQIISTRCLYKNTAASIEGLNKSELKVYLSGAALDVLKEISFLEAVVTIVCGGEKFRLYCG